MISSKIDPKIIKTNDDINLTALLNENPRKIEFVNDSFLKQFNHTIQKYQIDFPIHERK